MSAGDQYMSRTRGVIALEGARINLETAQGALLEREDTPQLEERENLGGPVSQLIGGLRDQLDALISLLSEGVSPDPDRDCEPDTSDESGIDVLINLPGEDDTHDGAVI